MTERDIILKYLNRAYDNTNPLVSIYVSGIVTTPKRAIDHLANDIYKIFVGIPNETIQKAIKEFLETKKKQYLSGEIMLKPMYWPRHQS
jgi:hypothetical protein